MGKSLHDSIGLIVSTIIALAVFLGGWRAFHAAEFKFAEHV
jgi:hypothetical protein